MPRALMLSLVASSVFGAACRTTATENVSYAYPDLDLSASRVEFGSVTWEDSETHRVYVTNDGDLNMGVESVALLEDEMEENFSISILVDDVDCPAGSSARVADTAGADDTGADDTGGGGDEGGGEEGSGEDDTTSTGIPALESNLVLEPGCKLPIDVTLTPTAVGDIYSSLVITTVTDSTFETYPDYYADPDNGHKSIILHGEGDKAAGNIIVSPQSIYFGRIWTEETETTYISVYNVGDGDLTLEDPELSYSCAEGFEVSTTWEGPRVLEGRTSTVIEVSFTAPDQDAAECTLTIPSSDADDPEVTVSLKANSTSDPYNSPPTVTLRSPEPGYLHNSIDPVELELNIFDVDQPAYSLSCTVKSAIITGETIADCTPDDESGHVFVEVPVTAIDEGIDTWLITVKDGSSAKAYASTTVLYRAAYPDSDDDGDGFDEDDEENPDCDDTDLYVYPKAAEIYDGKDNDCDGTVDEGTDGSDDDGDGYTEVDGDCDDLDEDTYPGASERGDGKDNDCDDEVDENTSLSDDDGDGFAETENDCDDGDPLVNPAAIETCDGIDNDCNGLKDQQDGCLADDSNPLIVGGIQMGATTIAAGETTTMSVFVFDADGDRLTYSWQQDADITSTGFQAIDSPTSQSIEFTAPSTLQNEGGDIYTIFVVVVDEDGEDDYAFADIIVLPESVELADVRTVEVETGGCGNSGGSALLFPLIPLLGAAARRRKRS